MLTREIILKTLADNRDALRSLGVRRLGLFGSFAREAAGPDSDLDFVVELVRKTFDSFMDLKLLLEDLFGRRVDLVLADGIKSELREQILADMIDAAQLWSTRSCATSRSLVKPRSGFPTKCDMPIPISSGARSPAFVTS